MLRNPRPLASSGWNIADCLLCLLYCLLSWAINQVRVQHQPWKQQKRFKRHNCQHFIESKNIFFNTSGRPCNWPLKKTFTIFPCVRAVKTTEITLQGLHGPEAWKTILKLREGLASLLNRLISSIVIFWIKSPIFYLPIIETVTMSEKVWWPPWRRSWRASHHLLCPPALVITIITITFIIIMIIITISPRVAVIGLFMKRWNAVQTVLPYTVLPLPYTPLTYLHSFSCFHNVKVVKHVSIMSQIIKALKI